MRLAWVNERLWCGVPPRPSGVSRLVREQIGSADNWVGQLVIPGKEVVIGRGSIFSYHGIGNLGFERRLKHCRDFQGRYVLARIEGGPRPTVQIHDVVSPRPFGERMQQITQLLQGRGIRESGYKTATSWNLSDTSMMELKSMLRKSKKGSEVILKRRSAPCETSLESTVESTEWIKLRNTTDVNRFFDKMCVGG